MSKQHLVVGTRGSKLALTQTNFYINLLKEQHSAIDFEIKIIKTKGDAGKIDVVGAFIKEIEHELLDGKIDLAVHSLKDMPVEMPKGLTIAAVPTRYDARDVFISNSAKKLKDLKQGAIIGTGSPRRSVQIKQLRPDIEIKHIQGNVDTRLEKLKEQEYDAIILAAAGLSRMNMLDVVSDTLSVEDMLPAVGQGAIAIQTREDDNTLIELIKAIEDKETSLLVEIEREVLGLLGGGCRMPIAAYAKIVDSKVVLEGIMATEDYMAFKKDKVERNLDDLVGIALELVNKIKLD